jgi:hypothetical protein
MNEHDRAVAAATLAAALISRNDQKPGLGIRHEQWAVNLFAQIYGLLPTIPALNISAPPSPQKLRQTRP